MFPTLGEASVQRAQMERSQYELNSLRNQDSQRKEHKGSTHLLGRSTKHTARASTTRKPWPHTQNNYHPLHQKISPTSHRWTLVTTSRRSLLWWGTSILFDLLPRERSTSRWLCRINAAKQASHTLQGRSELPPKQKRVTLYSSETPKVPQRGVVLSGRPALCRL